MPVGRVQAHGHTSQHIDSIDVYKCGERARTSENLMRAACIDFDTNDCITCIEFYVIQWFSEAFAADDANWLITNV